MDDSIIIELYFSRSEYAITETAKKYGGLCTKIAENILSSPQDAEECVNDTYLALWDSIPPNKPSPFVSYICRILRNIALKRHRTRTAQKRNSIYDAALDELAECIPSADSVETEFDARETAKVIGEFLNTIDKESRVMFVSRYWLCESVGELAERFGIREHNVSVRLSRIRGKLRKYLAERGVSV